MKNELAFQSRIIKAFKGDGGQGYKSSNRYSVGIPDLHIAHPDTGGFLIEAKMQAVPVRGGIPVGLTPNQRGFMADWIAAGGRAIVMSLIVQGKQSWVWASPDPLIERVPREAVFELDTITGGRNLDPAILSAAVRALASGPWPCYDRGLTHRRQQNGPP